jgi:hypothetical protein
MEQLQDLVDTTLWITLQSHNDIHVGYTRTN